MNLLVPTEKLGPSSHPLQIVPFSRTYLRASSSSVHVIPTPVTCSVRSPVLEISTDAVSPWVSTPLVSHSQTSGGGVSVGRGEVLVGGGAVFVGGTGDKLAVGDAGGEVSVGPGEVGDGGGEVSVGPGGVGLGLGVAVRVAVGAVVLEGVALGGRVPMTVGPLVGKMSNACWLAVGSPLGCVGGNVSGSGLPLA